MDEDLMRRRRRAASDPTRMRLLGLFYRGPWTANELGAELGLDPNRLYYHLRILEDADFITVVETRASGRMVERVFGLTDNWRVTWDVRDPGERSIHLGSLLEVSRAEAEEALFEQARRSEAGEEVPFLTYGLAAFWLEAAAIPEFNERLLSLVKEFRERVPEASREAEWHAPTGLRRLNLTYLLYEEARKARPKLEPAEAG